MDISKADAVAHLAKWRDAGTQVQAIYATITGHLSIVGAIAELSQAAVRIKGSGCEMLLYFRETSTFDYKDTRQQPNEANKDRVNKYPTVIEAKFSNGDRVEIMEFFS
jgi:hypothetical protein